MNSLHHSQWMLKLYFVVHSTPIHNVQPKSVFAAKKSAANNFSAQVLSIAKLEVRMALLWPADEDSLLFQACVAVGLLVVVAEAALPVVLGRLRQPLRAPLLPPREFQRRKRALQHEARALQLDVAAARSLRRQRRRSRGTGDRLTGSLALDAGASQRKARKRIKPARETQRGQTPVSEDRALRARSSTKKRKTAEGRMNVAPTAARQASATRGGGGVNATARSFVPPKPMVLVEAIETPPKVQLRGAARHVHESLPSLPSRSGQTSSERKQRLVYWESAAEFFRRDSPSVAATAATAATATAQSTVNDASQPSDKTSFRGEPNERVRYQTRGEAKQEEDELDPWSATRPHRSISVRLGVSADLDASDSSESPIASLIGARQRMSRRRRPLPATSLPEPRQPRFVPQFVTIASAPPRSEVLPGNASASAVSRWSPRAPPAETEERKEEGDRVEEELNGGADVMMMDLDTTRQTPGAVLATGMRLQIAKRTREQAFAPVSTLQSPPVVALPDT